MIGVAFAEVAHLSSKIHTPGDETLSFLIRDRRVNAGLVAVLAHPVH